MSIKTGIYQAAQEAINLALSFKCKDARFKYMALNDLLAFVSEQVDFIASRMPLTDYEIKALALYADTQSKNRYFMAQLGGN